MKKSLSILLAIALVFSMFGSLAYADEHELTAQEKFDALVEKGIFTGLTGEDPAGLDQDMTRAQFARIAGLLLGIDVDATPETTTFTDVAATAWYYEEVEAAVANGLMEGLGDGTFNPDGNISVQELAIVLANLLGLEEVEGAEVEGADGWAAGFVQAILDAGFELPTDYKGAAKRELLVISAYSADLIIDPPAEPEPAAKVTAVSAIDSTTIKVTFDAAVTAEAAEFAVADSAAAAVAVSSATSADAGKVVVLKVAAMTVGSKYTVTYGGVAMDVVATIADDTTKPALASASAVTGKLVRATFETRNINQDTLIAANFTLDNSATVSAVSLDTAEMAKAGQENNTVLLLDVAGLSAGKAFKLTSKNVASYEGAVATTSEATFAGKDADTTAPKVAGAVSVAGYKVDVTFTEDGKLDATALELTNYSITPALAITKAEFKKNELGNNIVTLYTADQASGTAYTLKVNKVSDGTTAMTTEGSAVFAGLDKVKNQTLVGAVATDATKVEVTLGYDANETALVAANYTIDNSITVTSAAFKADTTEVDGLNQTKVILTTSAMKSGIAYKLTVATAVQDMLGQGLKEAGTATFAGKDPDTSFGSVSAVSADKNTVTVTFGEEVDRASATTIANYSISDLGYPSSVTLNAAGKVATLKTVTQTAGKAYTITVNNIKDIAGNTVTANTKVTFTGKGDVVDRLKVSSVVPVSTTKIRVNFNQKLAADADLDESKFTLTNSSSDTLTFPAGATATAGNDYVILTVGTTALSSSKVYTFTVATDSDLAGQITAHTFATTAEADRKATFVGTDSATATFTATGAIAVSKTNVQVTFDTALDITPGNTDAGVLTLYTDSALTTGAIASNAIIQLSADKKTATFTMASALADSTVYYAKLLRAHDGVTEDFDTVDGAKLAVETDQVYKKITMVTGTLAAAADTKLDITSATMIDANTLEIVFNVDTLQDLIAGEVEIAKTSAGANVVTVGHVAFSDAKTARIYFTGDSALDNANGIHYVKITGTVTAFVGGSTTFGTDKSFESFAKNAATNAKPSITMVEPLTSNILKITASEKVYTDAARTVLDVADFVIYNNDTNVTLNSANYAITSNDGDKVFYVTLSNGVFLSGSNYQIGFADNVYGVDGYVKADIYAPGTSETANSINFGGIASAITTTVTVINTSTTIGGFNFNAPIYSSGTALTNALDVSANISETSVARAVATAEYTTAGNEILVTLDGAASNTETIVLAAGYTDAAGNAIGSKTITLTGGVWVLQ